MNYQHKRHHEIILQNGLKSAAHTYKELAEAQRLHTVQLRELSREVLGRDDGTFEEVIEGVRAVSARIALMNSVNCAISGKTVDYVVVDEVFDNGRPAKKGKRNGKQK